MKQEMGVNWATFGYTLSGLVLFGMAYAALVRRMASKMTAGGFTWVMVVGGNLVTVLASAFLIGSDAALIVLVCFAASGLPMAIESILRHAQDQEAARKVFRDGDPT